MEKLRSFFKSVRNSGFVRGVLILGSIVLNILCVIGAQVAIREINRDIVLVLGTLVMILAFVVLVPPLVQGKLSPRHSLAVILGLSPILIVVGIFAFRLLHWWGIKFLMWLYR